MTEKIRLKLEIANRHDVDVTGMPLRASVPMPEGMIRNPEKELALIDKDGKRVTSQWRVLSAWKDGSVRFALMDYSVPLMKPNEKRQYYVANSLMAKGKFEKERVIEIKEDSEFVEINAGRISARFSRKRFGLFEELGFDGKNMMDKEKKCDMLVEDAGGELFYASKGKYGITVEERGPVRAVMLIEGKFGNGESEFLNYKIRCHFVVNCPQSLVILTVRNRELPRGGVDFRRITLFGELDIGVNNIRRIRHSRRGKLCLPAEIEVPEKIEFDVSNEGCILRNEKSLRENPEDGTWSIVNNIEGKGWGICEDVIDLHSPEKGGMSFRVQDAVENAPVRLASEDEKFEIDVFPVQEKPFHFNQGMGKTRDLQLSFHCPELSAGQAIDTAGMLEYPGMTRIPGDWYRECKVADIHRTLKPQWNKYVLLESKIDTLLDADRSILWPDARGWRDYGDEIGGRGDFMQRGVYQYINNEEDYLFALMIDAWRNGIPYKGKAQARHLMDIDYIDFSTEPQRDGGDCSHSANHTDGEVYPSHQWCEGLMHYYLATGDPEALRISKRIGDNLCWWINGPYRQAVFFTGRESCWPLQSLACLYDLTREEKYINSAMDVVNELMKRFEEHGENMWEYSPGKFQNHMYPMTFDGLWAVYKATRDEGVLEFWKKVTKVMIDKLEDPDNYGYIHFRNWPLKWADLTVLDHWYELTGDEKYVRLGRNGLKIVLVGSPDRELMFQGLIAMGYRHFIFFLKLADEFGMIEDDKVTYVW